MIPFGKKDRLAAILARTKTLPLIMQLRRKSGLQLLTVLTYHRIAKLRTNPWYDPNIVDATPEQFAEQLTWIARHFNVISVADLCKFFTGQSKLPPNPCLITFDDGYKECFEIAKPILERHSLVATFFISTNFVDRRQVYWWDRIHYLFHRSKETHVSIKIAQLPQTETRFALPRQRREALEFCLRTVKDTRGLELERFLIELANSLQVDWSVATERRLAEQTVMAWSEIKSLKEAGMDIGSHTCSHRVLDTLSAEELSDELRRSKNTLEAKISAPVEAIAYPVGRSIAPYPDIVEAVYRAGYSIGFSNLSGIKPISRGSNRFNISRLAMDQGLSRARFETMTTIPGL